MCINTDTRQCIINPKNHVGSDSPSSYWPFSPKYLSHLRTPRSKSICRWTSILHYGSVMACAFSCLKGLSVCVLHSPPVLWLGAHSEGALAMVYNWSLWNKYWAAVKSSYSCILRRCSWNQPLNLLHILISLLRPTVDRIEVLKNKIVFSLSPSSFLAKLPLEY